MTSTVVYTDNPEDPGDPLVVFAKFRGECDDTPDASLTYRGLLARCWHEAVAELGGLE